MCGKLVRKGGLSAQLKPVFVTRVNRSSALMHFPQGEEVELALDEGVVETQSGSTPIHGVEMELKSREPLQLYEVALKLLDSVPLRIEHLSKGDRGYELLVQEHTEGISSRARSPRLPACRRNSSGLQAN